MKKKLVKIALALLCALTLSLAIGGCTNGTGGKKYDYLVTFNYNAGNILSTEVKEKYLGVKENSLVVMQPGVDADFRGETVQGYFVEGWYSPQTDGEGNPVVDEASGRVLLDKKWDFDTDRVTKDVTLYANLQPNKKLVVVGGDRELTFDSSIYGVNMARPEQRVPSKIGYTFLDYYLDEQCTQPFSWPYTFEEQEKTIYAKFLEGDWTLVSTAEEFYSAVSADSKPIYVLDNLDFTGVTWAKNRIFEFEINGNGKTLSNITCSDVSDKDNDGMFALFGYIAGANIHDITFENVTLSFQAKWYSSNPNGFSVAPFAALISAETILRNVVLTGSFTVSNEEAVHVINLSEKCGNQAEFDAEKVAGVDVSGLTVEDNRIE